MGTRSLLAYDTGEGNEPYVVQYMQFDGYPSVKGHEFYTAILRGLEAGRREMVTDGRPNTHFFTMVDHFLNHYQYESAHSIGGRHRSSPEEFWRDMEECNAEWKYLIKSNGDFIFFSTYESVTYVIPWEFTWGLVREDLSRNLRKWHGCDNDVLMDSLFSTFEGNKPAILTLETGEVKAFETSSYDDGYRGYGILRSGRKRLHGSMFSEKKTGRRKIRKVRTYSYMIRGLGLDIVREHSGAEDWDKLDAYLSDGKNLPPLMRLDPSLDEYIEAKLKEV